mmetsp:Transcript_3971/g.8428  ORF Transcript_3971/g.8428 Transcript_3971/m.8428 type:complete len:206 (+) Transcript_3971:486-1103(+)
MLHQIAWDANLVIVVTVYTLELLQALPRSVARGALPLHTGVGLTAVQTLPSHATVLANELAPIMLFLPAPDLGIIGLKPQDASGAGAALRNNSRVDFRRICIGWKSHPIHCLPLTVLHAGHVQCSKDPVCNTINVTSHPKGSHRREQRHKKNFHLGRRSVKCLLLGATRHSQPPQFGAQKESVKGGRCQARGECDAPNALRHRVA